VSGESFTAAAVQLVGGIALAPLLPGLVQHWKARLQGRRGPSPLQPYRELARLWSRANIDVEGRRLSLSIKDLEPNAWDRFFETHRLGDVVQGRVVRFASFGAFVEIEEGIEGLCHVSELSDERVEKPESAVKIGQVMPFKVLKLDPAQKKIGLSARAIGKESDPGDVRTYHETGAGMATLGDIANLISKKQED